MAFVLGLLFFSRRVASFLQNRHLDVLSLVLSLDPLASFFLEGPPTCCSLYSVFSSAAGRVGSVHLQNVYVVHKFTVQRLFFCFCSREALIL